MMVSSRTLVLLAAATTLIVVAAVVLRRAAETFAAAPAAAPAAPAAAPVPDAPGSEDLADLVAEADRLGLGTEAKIVSSGDESVDPVLHRLKDKYRALLVVLKRDADADDGEKRERKLLLVERLSNNLQTIKDILPSSRGETSVTINKRDVEMCLVKKPPDAGLFASLSSPQRELTTRDLHSADGPMLYVFLHELTHVAEPTRDHGDEFWDTFHWILRVAVRAGIYVPEDYEGENYCGINLNQNILYT